MSETFGKILTVQEAEQEIGSVTSVMPFNSEALLSLCNKENEKLMFRMYPEYTAILGPGRNLLSPTAAKIGEGDEFRVFSVSLVRELLDLGKGKETFYELRGEKEVFCLRSENFILEYGVPCPPFC